MTETCDSLTGGGIDEWLICTREKDHSGSHEDGYGRRWPGDSR